MKKILKLTLVVIIVIMTIFTITACESGSGPRGIPDLERITNELLEDGRSIIPNTETINSVEIISEETDRETHTHRAAVLVHSKDDEVAFIRYAIMIYNRNEEREWILSGINPDNQNQ